MRKSLIASLVRYFYNSLNLEVTERVQGGNSYKTITTGPQLAPLYIS